RPSGKGAVKSYRYGLFRKGESRFVIDLNRHVKVERPQVLQPEAGTGFRVVVDLTPVTAEAFSSQSGWPKDKAPPQVASLPPPPAAAAAQAGSNAKRMIVVDAGHGGIDPGTHRANGL